MYSYFAEKSRFANIGLQKSDLVFYSVTDSTNTRAREAFLASPLDAPRLYVAEEQTAGRGTRGRSFESKKGGLYFSLLYTPEAENADSVGMTAVAAAAVLAALSSAVGRKNAKRLVIKWVNDVYMDSRKICGILCERITAEEKVGYVIGIGINLYGKDFSPEVSKIAASVEELTGISADKEKLLYEILKRLVKSLPSPKSSAMARLYKRKMLKRGTAVTVTDGAGNTREATVMGLDEQFCLLVDYGGQTEHLVSGDVSIKF